MEAKVFFDQASSSFSVLLMWETSKISTTENLREANEWYCVGFYGLSSETSLIFKLAPRENTAFKSIAIAISSQTSLM